MLNTDALLIDFDFQRGSNNCRNLVVLDLSSWGPAILNPTWIDITTPGQTAPVTIPYQKQVINVYNTNNLNLSDVTSYESLGNLPDGAYQVCVRVCMGVDTNQKPIYESVCKYWLQDCMLQCKINRKILAIDLACQPCRKEYLDDILEVQLFLDAAHAQIDNCNVNKAMEYYRRASLELERLQEPGIDGDYRRKRDDGYHDWPGNRVY